MPYPVSRYTQTCHPYPLGVALLLEHMGRHAWYSTQRWLNVAAHQLQAHPLCAKCLSRGQVTPARVADHVVPHKGNANLFWMGELQSLCLHCHNRWKLIEELHGYNTDIDHDGWPIDPRHPANSGKVNDHR